MQKVIGDKAKDGRGISRMLAYYIGLFPWTYDLAHMCVALIKLYKGDKAKARARMHAAIDTVFNNVDLDVSEIAALLKKGA